MGADFHSLFELSENVDKENVEVIDAKWYHYIYDRPRKRNLWLPCIPQVFMFERRVYEKEMYSLNGCKEILDMLTRYNNVYLVHCGRFYEPCGNDLVPRKDIEKRVDEIIPLLGGCKKRVIGIHIRRTDNVSSIKNSPLELFTEEMDKELAADRDVLFYVASDSLEEKRKLVDRYKEHIITSFEQPQRNTPKGIIDAMVDLCALSRTEKIYGSSHSSFSELSARLTGIELKVLSLF